MPTKDFVRIRGRVTQFQAHNVVFNNELGNNTRTTRPAIYYYTFEVNEKSVEMFSTSYLQIEDGDEVVVVGVFHTETLLRIIGLKILETNIIQMAVAGAYSGIQPLVAGVTQIIAATLILGFVAFYRIVTPLPLAGSNLRMFAISITILTIAFLLFMGLWGILLVRGSIHIKQSINLLLNLND